MAGRIQFGTLALPQGEKDTSALCTAFRLECQANIEANTRVSCALGHESRWTRKKVHHYVYLYMKCEISLVVQMSWNEERTFVGTYD